MEEVTARTREEGRALARRQRAEARRAIRAQTEGLGRSASASGGALETRRRLRPVFAPVARLLSAIAPFVTGSLLFAVRLVAAVPLLLLAAAQAAIGWSATRGVDAALASGEVLRRVVTPLRTAAFVGVAAAVALGASQFADYRGVAVDASAYAGELGATAPVPITDKEAAGSAHLWILLPLAAVLSASSSRRIAGPRSRPLSRSAGARTRGRDRHRPPPGARFRPGGNRVQRFRGAAARGFLGGGLASAALMLSGALLALYSGGDRCEESRTVAAPARRRARDPPSPTSAVRSPRLRGS